ncbi:MAG TPA: hypothetical protein VG274_00280 [Rhizomicrobium sp.]|nr:hypothetical protein [Rhizomicrobium sp.]
MNTATGLGRRPHAQASLIAAGTAIVLGWAVSVALNWPGQLSYDSVAQLHDGRTGHYNAWHPPIMAWMLGLADAALPGTGLFILFDAFLLFGGMLSILWIAPRVSWGAVAIAAVAVALPQFVLYQGIVWKDVLFADAAIAGFVLLAHAASRWASARLRWALIVAAFLLFALATLARQNGAIALLFGTVALLAVARQHDVGWRGAIVRSIGTGTAAALVVLAASLALAQRASGGSGPLGQIRLLQLYDLIGEAKAEPGLGLDVLSRTNPDLERLIRSDGVRLYTPARNDTLYGSTELLNEFASTSPDAIASQWWSVMVHHPLDYLGVRAHVFAWTFVTPDPIGCEDWYVGVTGFPQYLHELGLERRIRPQDRALGNYANLFVGTPIFSHATYALLAAALLFVLLRRRRPADLAIASLLVCALVFTASFFAISIACDYRYLLFLDLATFASCLYCGVTWNRSLYN